MAGGDAPVNMPAIDPLEKLHEDATAIFKGALVDCSIATAFDLHFKFEGGKLLHTSLNGEVMETIDLSHFKRIYVVSIGKAGLTMVDILLDRMKRRKGVRGVVCSPEVPHKRNWRFRYFAGGHPVPNEDSLNAARAALALMKKSRRDTFVFFLISGGGSAMFDLPLDPTISLDDTIALHETLLACGAPIASINIVRKQFSAVKGGRLAAAAPEAEKFSILLPDVPMSTLEALSSSPTFPNTSTQEEFEQVLAQYQLLEKFPTSVRELLERPGAAEPETHKGILRLTLPGLRVAPKEQEPPPHHVDTLLNSDDLVHHAKLHATQLGYTVVVDNECDDWDYADAAHYLLKRLEELRRQYPRLCLLSAGEVTVTMDRKPGAGGRNQHMSLKCALELAAHPEEQIVVLNAGSDGIDGNTRTAGAIADPTTVQRAIQFGFDPQQALVEFNACPMFTSLGDSVVTGPTGHNLRDLRVLLSVTEP